ncbi:MAG TPA: hypothetical protein P5096_03575 [Patescibacteria group bacterium]|nr:hypothetical protein [Patescibacteria group bacterium]
MKKLTIIAIVAIVLSTIAITGTTSVRADDISQAVFTAYNADPSGGAFKATGYACLSAVDPIQGAESESDYGITYALRVCSGDSPAQYNKRACKSLKSGVNRTAVYMRGKDAKLVIMDCHSAMNGSHIFFQEKESMGEATFGDMDEFMGGQKTVNGKIVANQKQILDNMEADTYNKGEANKVRVAAVKKSYKKMGVTRIINLGTSFIKDEDTRRAVEAGADFLGYDYNAITANNSIKSLEGDIISDGGLPEEETEEQ